MNTPSTLPPKYPVPSSISKEAREFLSMPISTDLENAPSPHTTAEWEARIQASDQTLSAMLMSIIETADVNINRQEVAGVVVREVLPKDTRKVRPEQVILNLHGGGFTALSGELSVVEAIPLAESGFRVMAVDYRMLPHFPFPAAIEDGVAVYRKLLEHYAAESIALVGTSAGGNLVAAVTLAARDAGLPLPGAAVMHTPWSDLSKTGDSYITNEHVDPMMTSYEVVRAAAELYAGDAGLTSPLVSPVYGDYRPGFPPSLLSSGTRDLLLSCTVRQHRALREAGVDAELHVFEAMWHGFSAIAPTEGACLHSEVLRFLDRHLR